MTKISGNILKHWSHLFPERPDFCHHYSAVNDRLYCQLHHCYGLAEIPRYLNGSCLFSCGALAGIVCFYTIKLPRLKGWDDVLDVWGVHGVGGFLGTIVIGLLANEAVNGVDASCCQFFTQPVVKHRPIGR